MVNPSQPAVLEVGDSSTTAAATPLEWRGWLIVLGYAATLLGIGLGSSRVLTQHEVMFAEPAREMLATGDWVTPRLAGVPFNDKPPLTAWTIAAVMRLTGSESPWVVRLPALLAALVTVAWITAVASRWFGAQLAMLAGLVQSSTFYVLMQARLAESDMPLCAFVTTALGALAMAADDARPWRWWYSGVFYLGAALAFLTKGPLGLALVFPPAVLLGIWLGQRRIARMLLAPWAIAGFLALASAWPLAAYQANPEIGRDWWMHNLDRFLGRMDDGGAGGRKPALFYFYMIPALMLPWTLPLVLALANAVRQGRWSTLPWRWVAAWVVPGLTLLSLSVWKHKHYSIPILPPLSLLAAWGLWLHVTSRQRRAVPYGGAVLALLLLGSAIGLAVLAALAPALAGLYAVLVAMVALGGTAAWWLARRHRPQGQLAAFFATTWLVAVTVQLTVMPAHDSYRAVAELAARTNRQVPAGQPVYLLGLAVHQIAYYLDSPLIRVDNPVAARERLASANQSVCYAVVPRALADSLGELGQVEVLDECQRLLRHTGEADRLTLIRLRRLGEPAHTARNGPGGASQIDGPR